jgi:hypothetical protein
MNFHKSIQVYGLPIHDFRRNNMAEKFTKRIQKWGLERRVAKPDKPWAFVNAACYLFDQLVDAHKMASELNTGHGKPAYLYRPVEVILTVEVDNYFAKEG